MLTFVSEPISQKFRVSDFFFPPGRGGSLLSNFYLLSSRKDMSVYLEVF